MKKIKWIMLAVVLCLGLIGGAFAWWTDQVVVDGTVATGNLEITAGVTCTPLPPGYEEASGGNYESYDVMPVTTDGKTITFKIIDLYPRECNDGEDYLHMLLCFTNEGTVAAKVDNVTVTGTNQRVLDHVKFQYKFYNDPTIYCNDLATVAAGLPTIINGFISDRLEPGECVCIEFDVFLDEDAGNEHQNWGERAAKMQINWVQFNQPLP